MQIDSMVGIGMFLVFVAWSFNFYSAQFQEQAEPLKGLADTVHGKVIDYLEIEAYTMPVRFNSPGPATATLYLALVWPGGTENSTRIKAAGQSLECEIAGDYVYWQGDLEEGNNYFTLEIANTSAARNCLSSFNKSVTNHTMVFAGEMVRLVSQSRINSMAATDYSAFKGSIGVSGLDFRVGIENSTGTLSYGPAVPVNRDVYVPVSSNRVWESDDSVNITVSVWH